MVKDTFLAYPATCFMAVTREVWLLETGLFTVSEPRRVMLEGSVASFVASDHGGSFGPMLVDGWRRRSPPRVRSRRRIQGIA